MCGTRLEILPLVLFFWFIFTFILLYAWAVIANDVHPIWPYISDTGSLVPESCLFGQLLTIGSILMAVTLYIRFAHVRHIQNISNNAGKTCEKNLTCLILGLVAALGISVVANFQESNAFFIHIVGAIMAFGCGSVYQLIMWKVSVQYLEEYGSTKKINTFRLVLALVSTICFCICFGFAGIALLKFTGENVFKWSKEDGGYALHLVSTISEWICAVSTMTYIMTFYKEFKTIKMYEPTVELKH